MIGQSGSAHGSVVVETYLADFVRGVMHFEVVRAALRLSAVGAALVRS